MLEKIKFLDTKITDSISEYKIRRRRMFKVVCGFKYPVVGLAMISTIILGIELKEDLVVYQKNAALIIGAIITALVTLSTFWNIEEYWIKNKVIELQLQSLYNSLQFERMNDLTETRLRDFFNQYQSIIGQREELWKIATDEGKV